MFLKYPPPRKFRGASRGRTFFYYDLNLNYSGLRRSVFSSSFLDNSFPLLVSDMMFLLGELVVSILFLIRMLKWVCVIEITNSSPRVFVVSPVYLQHVREKR